MNEQPRQTIIGDFWDGLASECDNQEYELKKIRSASREYCPVGELKSNIQTSTDIGLKLLENNRKLGLKNVELRNQLSTYTPLLEEYQQLREEFEKYGEHNSQLIARLTLENEQLRAELAKKN